MFSSCDVQWYSSFGLIRYLYWLFVSLDANFRLKNRLRCRNRYKKDQPLYNGLRYQVPQKAYFDHLKTCVTEDDVSIFVDGVCCAHIFNRSVPVLLLLPLWRKKQN